jgi:hypothetical protein
VLDVVFHIVMSAIVLIRVRSEMNTVPHGVVLSDVAIVPSHLIVSLKILVGF